MALDLIPNSFWNFPSLRYPSIWGNEEDFFSSDNGLSVYEDDKNVYVEAAVPGIKPEDIEVTVDRGVLWIRGNSKEEEKNKKFYKKASQSFSYRVTVPGNIDEKKEPEAECENGVMRVTFPKAPTSRPKKIAVKRKKK